MNSPLESMLLKMLGENARDITRQKLKIERLQHRLKILRESRARAGNHSSLAIDASRPVPLQMEPTMSQKSTALSTTKLPLATLLADFYKAHGALPNGIYIGLSNERYHADPALGSTNIRDILKGANNYWAKSPMNPKRKKRKLTDALIVGNAIHKLLLEGSEAFNVEYIRGPYDGDFDGSSSEKAQLTKTAKKTLLENQELIVADVYDYILGIKEIIDADPELEGCLDGGLTEVSIFWTRPDGVRCKARLDALKIHGIGDIKSIANERDRDLEEACLLDIKTYRYDIPVSHYSEGRRQMAKLVAAGLIFFGDDTTHKIDPPGHRADNEDRLMDYLDQCAAIKAFGFQLVFIPKSNKTGTNAPDAWSCTITPGNEIELSARTDIETAIERYKRAMEEFGPDRRWTPNREVREIGIADLPFGFGRIGPRTR